MENEHDDNRLNDSNCGFWDRPVEERAAVMGVACDRGGVDNFFDLSPEERADAYNASFSGRVASD